MMMAKLGILEFNINTPIESISESVTSNIEFKQRIGLAPRAIKKLYPDKTLAIEAYVLKEKEKEFFKNLYKISKNANIERFLLGNGQVLGHFCVESYEKTAETLLPNGSSLILKFSLSLKQVHKASKNKIRYSKTRKKNDIKNNTIVKNNTLPNLEKLISLDTKKANSLIDIAEKEKWKKEKIENESKKAIDDFYEKKKKIDDEFWEYNG